MSLSAKHKHKSQNNAAPQQCAQAVRSRVFLKLNNAAAVVAVFRQTAMADALAHQHSAAAVITDSA